MKMCQGTLLRYVLSNHIIYLILDEMSERLCDWVICLNVPDIWAIQSASTEAMMALALVPLLWLAEEGGGGTGC